MPVTDSLNCFYDGRLVGLFSGGKDSLVACLVAGVKEVLYCRTGVGLNEYYVRQMCSKLNWKLTILQPKEGEYERFCKKYGFPRPTSHSWIMQRLKLNPITKWYKKESKIRDVILVSGIRTAESNRRKRKFPTESGVETSAKIKFYRPILKWSNRKVEDYIKEHSLEISPTYATLGLGGDCLCGAFTKRQHGIILNNNYPVLAERIKNLEKECRGKWGQFMSLTACEKQGGIEDFICSECMLVNNKR